MQLSEHQLRIDTTLLTRCMQCDCCCCCPLAFHHTLGVASHERQHLASTANFAILFQGSAHF
jgi:hypothetical protein